MIFEGDVDTPPFGKREPENVLLDAKPDGSKPTDEEVELFVGFVEYERFQRFKGNGR